MSDPAFPRPCSSRFAVPPSDELREHPLTQFILHRLGAVFRPDAAPSRLHYLAGLVQVCRENLAQSPRADSTGGDEMVSLLLTVLVMDCAVRLKRHLGGESPEALARLLKSEWTLLDLLTWSSSARPGPVPDATGV